MPPQTMTVRQVAQWIGATVEGDDRQTLSGLAAIDQAEAGELTFAADDRRVRHLADCRAAAAIVPAQADAPAKMTLLRVDNVPAALAALLGQLAGEDDAPPAGMDASAVVSPQATLGEQVAIGPNVVVSAGAVIGPRTVLSAGVFIGTGVTIGSDGMLAEGVVIRRNCSLGDRVRIGPNSVIGYDGFGYRFAEGRHHRIPHAGTVVIEDDVELGACVCVDRAKFSRTRVGRGTKVDNLVQIAHNVDIGPDSIVVAQVGIAGSARIGHHVVLGGAASIRDNIQIGDAAQVGARSGVMRDVPAGQTVIGAPAYEGKQFFRMFRALEALPELAREVRRMQKRLDRLEGSPQA